MESWSRIKAGQRVIVSDETLDALAEHFNPQDTIEASVYFGDVASVPNPKRVGIRDQYIAYLSEYGLKTLRECAELGVMREERL